MTRDDHQTTAASTVFWNLIVPALGIALLLGAPLLPALALAGAASLALLAPGARRTRRRRWAAHVAPARG